MFPKTLRAEILGRHGRGRAEAKSMPIGIELITPRQDVIIRKNKKTGDGESGGRDRARTGDPLLAKQVLSQLSYTPTVEVTFILKHFSRFQNSFLGILVRWSEPLF